MAQNNFKITSIEDVRNAARNINAASEKQNEERRAAIEKVLNGVNSMPFDRGNFDEFAVILALPEEKFAILAPIFMEEFEKSYNNATDKILLAQSINVSGQRLEDIHDTFENMILNIDLEFSEILSQQKRDFLKRILIVTYNAIAETEGIVKRIVDIPIELTSENAKVPKYANLGDGAVDLYSPGDYVIKPGETVIIPCDIKVAIPYGYGFLIHPRSGLSAKTKLRIANSIGLIDSQYKGVIGVIASRPQIALRCSCLLACPILQGLQRR